MSSNVQFHSRGDLYEQYKQSNPELAKAFLGRKYNNILTTVGGVILVAAILASIVVLSILGSVSHGFAPSPDPTFYTIMFSIIGGIYGACALAGLTMLAIGYCQKRAVLAEQLPDSQVQAMISESGIQMKTITQ